MKILHVVFYNPIENNGGGIENVVSKLATNQLRRGDSVTIICQSDKSEVLYTSRLGKIIKIGLPNCRIFSRFKINVKKIIYNRKLRNYINANGAEYDIIHIHGDLCGFKELHKYNTIVTFHGFTENASRSRNIFARIVLYYASIRYELANIRYCKKLVSVSEKVKADILLHTKKSVRVIYNGINTELYKPVSEREKKRLRTKLGMQKDTYYALFIGKDKYIKGLDIASRAVKLTHSKLHINVIGVTGKNEERVTFLGPLYARVKLNYMNSSDMLIAPSRYDAFPVTILEAMGCGLPVFISRNVGTKELITNGQNGIILEHNVPEAYSTEIDSLLNNKERLLSISIKARKVALESSDKIMCDAYYAEYIHLLANRLDRHSKYK